LGNPTDDEKRDESGYTSREVSCTIAVIREGAEERIHRGISMAIFHFVVSIP
jgi:hypothetical protein